MKNLLRFYFLFLPFSVLSQDTIYLDKDFEATLDKTQAVHYEIKEVDPDDPDAGFLRKYHMSGQIYVEEYFSSYKKRVREGKRKLWRKDGNLYRESEYKQGKLDGYQISYWDNGQLKRKDFYKKGKLKEKKVWDMAGNPAEWYPLEQRPVFPGGEKALKKYLKENTNKPDGIAGGRVLVGFVIDHDGSVTDVRIEKSSSPALNLSAFNTVAQMPAWTPGKQDGETVRVKFSLPFVFRD